MHVLLPASDTKTTAPPADTAAKEKCQQLFTALGASTTPGIKYGADFLVYLGSPDTVHSSFAVNVDSPLTFKILSGLVRVSSSTKKATVCYTEDPALPFVAFTRFFL